MIEGELALIVDATRQASRFLLRDYFELENLQISNRNNADFTQKSCMKVLQILNEKLGKYFKNVIFDVSKKDSLNLNYKAVLVETIDGFTNLTRSLPFFSIMITLVSRKDNLLVPEKSVMNFPALGEIYYTEKGRGAWIEKYNTNQPGAFRLKVSRNDNLNNAILSTNAASALSNKLIRNFRLYDSYSYSLAQFIAGKLDVIVLEPSEISTLGIKLFIEETGGIYIEENQKITASNSLLFEKIKHICN